MKVWKFELLSDPFVQSIQNLAEKIQKSLVSWHWRVMRNYRKNWLLDPKLTWGIWWIFTQALKSPKFCTFMCYFLSIAYKVSAEKVQKNYLSWHWKKIQTLKKNWLFVWKVTWGIWWTLTQATESLKICTLMGYFCRNYVVFELKKIQRSCVVKSDIMISNLVNFHTIYFLDKFIFGQK